LIFVVTILHVLWKAEIRQDDFVMRETTQSSDLEENKQIIGNFFQDVFERHDIAAADKYFPENPGHLKQLSFKQFLSEFFQRIPDIHTTVDHIVAEDDRAMLMMTGTATDSQKGKQVTLKSADLYRIENGKIVEHWDVVARSQIE
jgi:predicted SnoaL-like aldol condensation-catalyzing enzyme